MKNNVVSEDYRAKRNCTGCGSCALICPRYSIEIRLNREGFYQPYVNASICVECGLCIQVCIKYEEGETLRNPFWKTNPIFSYKNRDRQILKQSSSGGFIDCLLQKGIEFGYDVCGCIYDYTQHRVKHVVTSNKNDLYRIRGSKYLQSFTVDAFSSFQKNQKCIVVGTPCQIFGLSKYLELRKIRNNFILIDLFCAGVPSYILWDKYLRYIDDKYKLGTIQEVNFRSKVRSSWHKYGILIRGAQNIYYQDDAAHCDLFYRLFLSDACKNKCCNSENCFLRKNSYADLRVGDFWGNKYRTDEDGVSLVVIKRDRCKEIVDLIPDLVPEREISIPDLNPPHPQRSVMMEYLRSSYKLEPALKIIQPKSFISSLKKCLVFIKRIISYAYIGNK